MPATWMIALQGSFPELVITVCPSGNAPSLPNSLKGCKPASFFIAPETPCEMSNHQGIILRFHALTMTSISWLRRSPFIVVISIDY